MESAGGVKRMENKARADAGFAADLERAHAAYAADRDAASTLTTAPQPSGGVGGSAQGVKCLHAHYAHQAAGGENPAGELVAAWIEPLDCDQPCVVDGAMNPDWVNRP